jgi:hypothetical protein
MSILRTSSFNPKYSDFIVRADGRGTYSTIGAAITAASELDGPQTVLIGPGVYTEDLVLQYNVSLLSLNTPSTTINFENEGSDLVPDTAETIIKGNHIVSYNVNPHIITLTNIRFESNDVDAPILLLHNLDSAPTEEVYGSVFKFKNCTLSQFEVGAPTDYEVVSCPATTMFGGLQCEFEESTIFMATPSMFILESGIGEARHGNSFTFKNCMLFNAVEGSLSSFYITDASLTLINCKLYTASLFTIDSTNSDCNLRIEDSRIAGNGEIFRDNSEGLGQTNITAISSYFINRDVDGFDTPIFEALNKEMFVRLVDCTIENRPSYLTGGLAIQEIANTLNTSTAYTGDITFDGVKIIGAGTASGDNAGYSTMELVPDNDLYGNNQYLIVDPTGPNHIHIRAGGTQDASTADLFLGGERTGVQVSDATGDVNIRSKNPDQVNIYANSNGTSNTQFIHATGADIIVGDTVRLYAGGDLFTVTSVTPDSPGAGSMTVVADGLTFITGESYNFYRSQGENIWQFDSDRKLNFPGYQNSQSFNNSNGSLEIATATSGTAWTGNKYHSTVKLIIQGEYSGVSDYEVQSCEVLLVRSSGTVVNHITYGTVYTHDPLFTVTSSVDGGSGDTVLEVNNLTAGNLYISTFATTLGSRD